MTVLGEAFIEVRGDLKPYIRDLDRELKAATERFEKHLQQSFRDGLKDSDRLGEETGDKLGAGLGRRLKQGLGDKKKPPWVNITAALASALDDGISALPAEMKAALVLGLVAALPFISGALAGAVTAALAGAFAGIGTFIAFQFEEVEQRGSELLDNLRLLFVRSADAFAPAVLRALDTIEARFERLEPLLSKIFDKSAGFLGPLVDGTIGFIEELLEGVSEALGGADGFIDALSDGLKLLGAAAGEFFNILADTGESGEQAFRDFIQLTANFIVNLAKVLALFTEIYAIARDLFIFVNPLLASIGGVTDFTDRAYESTTRLGTRTRELGDTTSRTIKLTDEETKSLIALDKALKDAADATFGLVESQIGFERSLDNIQESLQENGKTLDITKEKGRENAESFIAGIKAAEEATRQQVANGQIASQEAAGYYDDQIQKVRDLALQAGITNAQFDTMFGNIIDVAQLRLDAEAMGLVATKEQLAGSGREAAELLELLRRIKAFRLPSQGTRGFSEFAEGGIVSAPTHALIGEAGPEAVIPLTRPARAAELMRLSGLDKMLQPATPTVNVFVGNEQLDARTYRIVTDNNEALSTSLAFGARGL